MGFDCTLHVVDEAALAGPFTDALLAGRPPDEDSDPELWQEAIAGLTQAPPEQAARAICELALRYSARSLPYHSERGFALSRWGGLPEELRAEFPAHLTRSPETVFRRLVQRHRRLRGQFPTAIRGNYETGLFIPAAKIPAALRWLRARRKSLPPQETGFFHGLFLVLEYCSRTGLAYWEASDLPLPQATLSAPGAEQRRAERSWLWPPHLGTFQLVACAGHRCVISHGPNEEAQTCLVDFSQWPPGWECLAGYARAGASSPDGRLVIVRTEPDAYSYWPEADPFWPGRRQRWTAEAPELIPRLGCDAADFLAGQIVARPAFDSSHRTVRRVPLFARGEWLVGESALPPALDRAEAFGGEWARFGVARTGDGSEVLIWRDKGYELTEGTWRATFAVGGPSDADDWSSLPAGPDGFYYLDQRELYHLRRGGERERHLPSLGNIRHLRPGPAGSLLLPEGDSPLGDWGKLYFPASREWVRLRPALVPEVAPAELVDLAWVEAPRRLLILTPHEVWFVPGEEVALIAREAIPGPKRR